MARNPTIARTNKARRIMLGMVALLRNSCQWICSIWHAVRAAERLCN